MKALLIVDVQNDFCPGGALAVYEGDLVVPIINSLMDHFELIVASKDWHPSDTVHFTKWPVHCVQNSHGAEFHPGLDTEKIQKVFFKGTENKDDGYSAFEATNEDLAGFLKRKGVTDVYVAGLATDYCVKATALDAARLGFQTHVIKDACRGVGKDPDDVFKAMDTMRHHGISLIVSDDFNP